MARFLAFAAVVSLLATITQRELCAQAPNGIPDRLALIERKTLPIADDEPELSRLIKMRLSAAIAETREKYHWYRGGKVTIQDLLEAGLRLQHAAIEEATTLEQKVATCKECVEFCRNVEAIVRDKVENEIEPNFALDLAQYHRYDAEIRLNRARQAAATR